MAKIGDLVPEPADLETWKNPTAGRVWVNRIDHRGDLKKVEIVGSGRVVHLSPAERRLNQEMAANVDQDVFANGTLTPIRLVGDDAEEAAAFAANPNMMTEGDMRTLVAKPKGKADTFVERLGEIKNPGTLQRLLSLAREEDASLSRVEAIQARLGEVAPAIHVERVSSTAPTPVSAEAAASPSPSSRRQGSSRAVTPS